jgi:hypothetical protein
MRRPEEVLIEIGSSPEYFGHPEAKLYLAALRFSTSKDP